MRWLLAHLSISKAGGFDEKPWTHRVSPEFSGGLEPPTPSLTMEVVEVNWKPQTVRSTRGRFCRVRRRLLGTVLGERRSSLSSRSRRRTPPVGS
jgi:hypothetical protein